MDMVRTVSNGKSEAERTSKEDAQSNSFVAAPTAESSGFPIIEEADDGVIAAAAISSVEEDAALPAQIPLETSADAKEVAEESEEDDYEYEEEDDAPYMSGFLVDNPVIAASRSMASSSSATASAPATIQDEDEEVDANSKRSTWREPTRDAVKMSLRAEKETSGGKRRLAQDLYRIMNQDTLEAGFSLEPSQEDSMDKWTIKLFKFDADSNLAKDMMVLGLDAVELEMTFPDQYPFEPPFVRVSRPRFKRQTGFVMNGALCMELLTKDGWNPVNDIESVIVSVRSLLVVGDGRLDTAFNLSETKYNALLAAADTKMANTDEGDKESGSADAASDPSIKRQRKNSEGETGAVKGADASQPRPAARDQGGAYSVSEAVVAYSHLTSYHKKKGWDNSGWWARKG